ncbi:hypothetical protein GM921_15510 [Pedobacter sp. LMG 31464]|uniref:Uncharacterized protein n=1 Tax=Pedobacter planticolens TaxID=2679964 RepID=A0A923IWA2_9SPHI|nr:hypothetical protein [Pedobacter planticolens]MBB2146911.1 hypothetical protein [Pedobacter planticolens]
MKKTLFILFIMPLILFGQQKPTLLQKIKTAAVNELKIKLNDPKSYEPASWGELKEQQTSFGDTERFISMVNEISELSRKLDNEIAYIKKEEQKKDFKEFFTHDPPNDSLINLAKQSKVKFEFSLDSTRQTITRESKTFQPIFKNYYIEHSFRSRNAYNGLILVTYFFRLSKEFNVIEFGNIEKL